MEVEKNYPTQKHYQSTTHCILHYKCGSYAMLVNDDELPPEGGSSFFYDISERAWLGMGTRCNILSSAS